MSHSFEEAIIRHCAATLAGHKCGSLFCHAACTPEDVESANAAMNAKGVRVVPLRCCDRGTLVYVYRPAALNARLSDEGVRAFLSERGYECLNAEACIEQMRMHIKEEAFPHEIGIFLDYPLGDVIAFIQNKGENCPLTGCWKAYTDEAGARRTFALYRKCRDVYLNCYARGIGVARLTVAA